MENAMVNAADHCAVAADELALRSATNGWPVFFDATLAARQVDKDAFHGRLHRVYRGGVHVPCAERGGRITLPRHRLPGALNAAVFVSVRASLREKITHTFDLIHVESISEADLAHLAERTSGTPSIASLRREVRLLLQYKSQNGRSPELDQRLAAKMMLLERLEKNELTRMTLHFRENYLTLPPSVEEMLRAHEASTP